MGRGLLSRSANSQPLPPAHTACLGSLANPSCPTVEEQKLRRAANSSRRSSTTAPGAVITNHRPLVPPARQAPSSR